LTSPRIYDDSTKCTKFWKQGIAIGADFCSGDELEMTDWALYVEIAVARWTVFVIFADSITAPATENLTTAAAKTIFKIDHALTGGTTINAFVFLEDIAL
jgi:hypothetical protein